MNMRRVKMNSARKITSAKNEIIIDETDEVGYKITNGIPGERVKSMKCIKMLNQQCRPNRT